jgi:hypothetical protein
MKFVPSSVNQLNRASIHTHFTFMWLPFRDTDAPQHIERLFSDITGVINTHLALYASDSSINYIGAFTVGESVTVSLVELLPLPPTGSTYCSLDTLYVRAIN